MAIQYQARWMSKPRRDSMLKSGAFRNSVVLDTPNGFIVVEPVDSHLGDGEVLAPEVAFTELSDAWCRESRTKLTQARKLLHLDELQPALA